MERAKSKRKKKDGDYFPYDIPDKAPKEVYESSLPYAIYNAAKTFGANVKFQASEAAKAQRLEAEVAELRARVAQKQNQANMKGRIAALEAEKARLKAALEAR